MTMQNLLIATEGFISLLSVLFFTCAHIQATHFRHQAAQHHALCNSTNCLEQPIPGIFSESISNCNLAIAIISTIVVLSRLTIRRLDTPRPIYILYDILMSSIWLLGFIQTLTTNSNSSKSSAEIPSACALTAGALVICVAAATVHLVRISTHVLSWLGYITQDENISPSEIAKDKAWLLEQGDRLFDQPLSPVLAFFPES